jgi:MerR family mercuric resistance operon transcriptional regulator
MDAVKLSGAGTLPIGALSRLTGVNIETIRYYERITILPAPPRTEGGRRVYGPVEIKTLRFSRRSRELGFTLDEIRNLLSLAEGSRTCAEVKAAAVAHLKDVRRKITDLRRMERTLSKTVDLCEGGDATHCPMLEILGE